MTATCRGCGSDALRPYTCKPPGPREKDHRCGAGCSLRTLICEACRLITGVPVGGTPPERSEEIRKRIRKAVNLKW